MVRGSRRSDICLVIQAIAVVGGPLASPNSTLSGATNVLTMSVALRTGLRRRQAMANAIYDLDHGCEKLSQIDLFLLGIKSTARLTLCAVSSFSLCDQHPSMVLLERERHR